MSKNFNIDPYYDDFDKTKGFHRILFNPSFAVQARELTQLQTSLQNQIEQFGSHIFKHGSMVVPGNSDAELGVPCVKIQTSYNSGSVDYSLFDTKTIVGSISGVRAYVKKAVAATSSDPITFYLSYLSGGVNSELTFLDGETLHVEGQPSIACNTLTSNANSTGSVAFIKAGVYYVNGYFVYCHPQIEVISKYDASPSAHVLLKIVEEVVNSSADESLLSPAQGSYNFAAPGADRYKISLILTTLPLTTAVDDNYIEIMRFDNGVMVEHVRSPKYNELEKSLAQRTFEESGNYIVNGFDTTIREHLKSGINSGVYPSGNKDQFVYSVAPGKAYFQGFPIEKIAPTLITADKARTSPDHVMQTSTITKPQFGQYFFVSSATGALDITNRETVQLWSISTSTGGTQLGTAQVIALDYQTGDGVNPIYRLFVYNIQFTNGTYEDIGSIRTASGNFFAKVVAEYDAPLNSGSFAVNDVVTYGSSVRTATVAFYSTAEGKLYAHRHTATAAPKIGDLIVGPNASVTIQAKRMVVTNGPATAIFSMTQKATKALKNAANAFDLEYIKHVKLTIAAGATTTSTVTGTLLPLEIGNFIALSSSGADAISHYSLNGTGTAIIRNAAAPAGGITIYAQVQVTNATPRTKSPTSYVATKSAATLVALDHADVYSVTSVVVGGIETINMWSLDSGANDYEYGVSKIKLKTGFSLPTGNLTISYKYFSHTAGDYFSVDSYSGIANEDIPKYRSPITGTVYQLRDVIDFRKTYSMPSNMVVTDSIVTTSVQKYIGRIDSLVVTKDSTLKVISGAPKENPRSPTIPTDVYELARYRIPAYTYDIHDIRETRIAVTRYTMTDIKKMDDRLGALEQFSTLTAAEAKIVNTPIIDAATGLDRFKTGYVVESMEDPFGMAAFTDDDFRASISSTRGIYPLVEQDVLDFSLWDALSNSYKITNGVITLNYTEVPLAAVGVSSRTTNLNPYSVVAWNGKLILNPPMDVWVDVIDNPETVVNNTSYSSVVLYNPFSAGPAPAFTIGPAVSTAPNPPVAAVPTPAVPVLPPIVVPMPIPVPAVAPTVTSVGVIEAAAPVPIEPVAAPAPVIDWQYWEYGAGYFQISQNNGTINAAGSDASSSGAATDGGNNGGTGVNGDAGIGGIGSGDGVGVA